MEKFGRFEGVFSWFFIKLETHTVERDNCLIATAQRQKFSYNKGYVAYFYCAWAKRPYFHFRSNMWRHHHVPRPQFPIRRENLGDSAINKGYIVYFYCAGAKRPYFHFRSKIWRHCRVPRPRFPLGREHFGESDINKGYIAYFLLRMSKTAIFPFPV